MSAAAKKQPAIPMAPVKSAQLRAIGYDVANGVLAVQFQRGGAIYHYPGVGADVHAEFMAAKSKGAFFAQRIKALPFTKLPAAPEVERLPADDTEGGAL
ncbi:KTSC domain-containing protein [Acidovorax sp. sif1233]|uniref:KTSC domain-containing protein n=1 Tax=Acidovorax sp. sif1233 TaxID=2854792 RepID=UPI001C43D9B5|nr:KTSC domain-containing protein [Acidovorax sp. sif1233]MBV7457355.1 KTSC domain-containing protein [Acidovorax sp. sif1233]